MEKKTKKLQLRKETIAVLNGERMTHVVGGTGYDPCGTGGGEGADLCPPPRPETEDIITLWPTDICPYSLKNTCVQICNTFENSWISCDKETKCGCA